MISLDRQHILFLLAGCNRVNLREHEMLNRYDGKRFCNATPRIRG
jgi:hypothetical protein